VRESVLDGDALAELWRDLSIPRMSKRPGSRTFRGAWAQRRRLALGSLRWGSLRPSMKAVFLAIFASLRAAFRSRAALQLEVLALRLQLAVYERRHARDRTKVADP
jgi:hypothetical protein